MGDDGMTGPAADPGPSGPPGDDARPGTATGESQAAEVEALRRELSQARDRLARARADYDNLQKRVARDADAERERNRARVLEGFLPVLELAHMAAHQAQAHPSAVSEGVVLLAREFDRLVQREGLVRTGELGEPVQPGRHEVVAQEAAPGVAPGHVSRVVQPGYLLGDKVLRFAKVCVQPGGGKGAGERPTHASPGQAAANATG